MYRNIASFATALYWFLVYICFSFSLTHSHTPLFCAVPFYGLTYSHACVFRTKNKTRFNIRKHLILFIIFFFSLRWPAGWLTVSMVGRKDIRLAVTSQSEESTKMTSFRDRKCHKVAYEQPQSQIFFTFAFVGGIFQETSEWWQVYGWMRMKNANEEWEMKKAQRKIINVQINGTESDIITRAMWWNSNDSDGGSAGAWFESTFIRKWMATDGRSECALPLRAKTIEIESMTWSHGDVQPENVQWSIVPPFRSAILPLASMRYDFRLFNWMSVASFHCSKTGRCSVAISS